MSSNIYYKCSICEKRFSNVDSFLTHHELHPDTSQLKNVCTQQGCLKKFGNTKYFKAHVRRVHVKKGVAPQSSNLGGSHTYQDLINEEFVQDFEVNQPEEEEQECSFYDDEDVSISEDSFIENDDDYLLEIAASLYGCKSMPIQKAEEVMQLLKQFSKRCSQRCSSLISRCNNVEDAKTLLENTELYDFSDYITEYKYTLKLISLDLFMEPTRPTMGFDTVEYIPGHLKSIDHHAVSNNIEFQLRKFLEIDNILEQILENQERLERIPEGTMNHFVNGEFWKSIVEKYPDKTLIPLFGYNDDFLVDNKIGPHSSTNKVSVFYFLIPTLPPHLLSKLESIFTGMAVKATDIKAFSNHSILLTLVNTFTALERNGLVLYAGTKKQKTVHIVMCKVLGDNLGLHAMCGFKQNFSRVDKMCITCETPLRILKKSWTVDQTLIRTVEKYENYFIEGTFSEYGLNEKSPLNNLPSFHVAENLIVDIMHDIQLGVGKFSLEHILSYFLRKKYFKCDTLNERIKNFNCGYKEAANKPSKISEHHIYNGLHMNANETLFLLRYLPIIILDLVPFDDPVYLYLLHTIAMVDVCFDHHFNNESLRHLKSTISDNRKKYLELFKTDFKPKDHHMLHYPLIIKNCGPLKYLSSIRFEAKHQVILAYTSNITNRRNICYSISKNQAFEFAYFLIKGKEKYLSKITIPSSKTGSQMKLPMEIFIRSNNFTKDTYTSVNRVVYLGTEYRINDFIMINENTAIKIVQIFVSLQEKEVTIAGLKHVIRFEKNLRMYEVFDALDEGSYMVSSFKYPSINALAFKDRLFLKEKFL